MPILRQPPIRLDLSWGDLAAALRVCVPGGPLPEIPRAGGAEPPLACLCVRTGFDLFLQALALPPGSEVLVGALTHPDMVAIMRHHGLVPLPVDVCPDTLVLRPEALRRALSPRVRAVLVTHLFGAWTEVGEVARFCREEGLQLWEDCAQAFTSREDRGHPDSAVAMFSFGPLKTSTALAGALIYVGDSEIRGRMEALHERYPVQSNREFALRVLKYAGVRVLLSGPVVFGLLARAVESRGRSVMEVTRSWASGFPGPFDAGRLRRRPSPALLRALARRLRLHDGRSVQRRRRSGEWTARLMPRVERPGQACPGHTHWIFPVLVDDPGQTLRDLAEAGFQGIPGLSNLVVLDPPVDRLDLTPLEARRILAHSLLVPVHPALRAGERARMARVLEAHAVGTRAGFMPQAS